MKKTPDLNHVLEVFWLIISVFTALMGVYVLFRNGFKSAYVFFIMSLLSFLLYLARHTLRLKNKNKLNE
jgi:asparagine N-glycosylation enzyme membrane subunit Stt3